MWMCLNAVRPECMQKSMSAKCLFSNSGILDALFNCIFTHILLLPKTLSPTTNTIYVERI